MGGLAHWSSCMASMGGLAYQSSRVVSARGLARVLLRVLPVKKSVLPVKKTMMTCGVHGGQADSFFTPGCSVLPKRIQTKFVSTGDGVKFTRELLFLQSPATVPENPLMLPLG
jgi:hypothetical protein